jgi:hypothetical protein
MIQQVTEIDAIGSLNDEFFSFVEQHLHADPKALMLRYGNKAMPFPLELAITQIEARRKGGGKVPSLCDDIRFLFPSALLAEQCTGEVLARFHADIIAGELQHRLRHIIDLTCGLCVDAFTFCTIADHVDAVDINPLTAAIANVNAATLHYANFKAHCGDAFDLLSSGVLLTDDEPKADLIYIDPARRKASTARAYGFADCSPNIIDNLALLQRYSHRVMIKASPMLDITQTLKELPSTSRLWVIAVKGECKEVLVELDFDMAATAIEVIAIDPVNGTELRIPDFADMEREVTYAADEDIAVGKVLCEPNAAVMKTGAWGELAKQWPGMKKLHRNTHLFIADALPDAQSFPGRCMRIDAIYRNHKEAASELKGVSANVATRNYPLKADELRKKLKLRDSSDAHRFVIGATVAHDRRILLDCSNN